jgi:hypothetical protein
MPMVLDAECDSMILSEVLFDPMEIIGCEAPVLLRIDTAPSVTGYPVKSSLDVYKYCDDADA